MPNNQKQLARGYASAYAIFDSPLMRKVRAEAFDEDIGQYSWITADELRGHLEWLNLSASDKLLDYGCGPAGPLSYIIKQTGVRATGIDLDSAALESARKRASSMGLDSSVHFQQVDANQGLPFEDDTFDAVVSIDVVMHLSDREVAFKEIFRVLKQGGYFLFTDAGIVSGQISNEQIRIRSHNGFSQYVADGFNDDALNAAGFTLARKELRTLGPLDVCSGRLRAREKYKRELVDMLGEDAFDVEQTYLKTMVELYSKGALVRYAYLGEKV